MASQVFFLDVPYNVIKIVTIVCLSCLEIEYHRIMQRLLYAFAS